MNLGLTNKVAVVTGASRGIGKAIAFGFAKEGARLSICGRDPDTLQTVTEELGHTAQKYLPNLPM